MKLKLISHDKYFKRAKFVLLEDLEILDITIPKGTVTDGISVPRIATPIGLALFAYGMETDIVTWMLLGLFLSIQTLILPTFGVYNRAVLAHDYYFEKGQYTVANLYLNEILKLDGVSFVKRKYIMYAVTLYKWVKCGLRKFDSFRI